MPVANKAMMAQVGAGALTHRASCHQMRRFFVNAGALSSSAGFVENSAAKSPPSRSKICWILLSWVFSFCSLPLAAKSLWVLRPPDTFTPNWNAAFGAASLDPLYACSLAFSTQTHANVTLALRIDAVRLEHFDLELTGQRLPWP